MKNIRITVYCLYIIVAGTLSGWSQTKVLLIGNSQLGVYDGITGKQIYDLAGLVKDISESAPSDYPRIEISQKLVGGASLKKHWEMGEGSGTPRTMIASGKWDYVIIQEIYHVDKQEFETYATMFDEFIRKSGAKTILFATAGVTNYYAPSFPPYPDEFKTLNGMQVSFGKEKRIPVAAAGYAWMKYLGRNPSEEQLLDLYHKDKGHPGYKGSYIYACLLYAVITGKNPTGLTSEFKNNLRNKGSIIIAKEEATKMQKAAWNQYQKNRNKSKVNITTGK
jgi:hypothetical protein